MAGATQFPGTSIDNFGDVQDGIDDVQDDHINDMRRAIEAIETKLGIDSSAVTASIDYKVNNFFVTNRKLWLYETGSAPTGWSIAGVTDTVLAVQGGSTYTIGGTTQGEWDHDTHVHQWWDYVGVSSNDRTYNSAGTNVALSDTVNSSNVRAFTTRAATGSDYKMTMDAYTTAVSTPNTYRPLAAVGIIVIKS